MAPGMLPQTGASSLWARLGSKQGSNLQPHQQGSQNFQQGTDIQPVVRFKKVAKAF